MLGDPFAERQVDPARMVDEDAQHFLAGLLDSDDVEVRVELGKLLSGCPLGGLSYGFGAKKKWARPTSRYCRVEKACAQYSPLVRALRVSTLSRIESAIESLDAFGDRRLAGRVDQRHGVLLALEADRSNRRRR